MTYESLIVRFSVAFIGHYLAFALKLNFFFLTNTLVE